MAKTIFVIGHKSPDLDSVAAAIGYAYFKNKTDKKNSYQAAVAGRLNRETKFVLKKFGFSEPLLLKSLKNKKVILVDHNEESQSAAGQKEAELIEVLDHHKVNFQYSKPIYFQVYPWGASATIVAQKFLEQNIKIPKKLAALLLSAILVDTVITKSPTCTSYDKKTIKKLAELVKISNWRAWGREIFEVRSDIRGMSPLEIIKNDFKDFQLKNRKIGIGQIETVNLSQFDFLKKELLERLEKLAQKDDYHSLILFVTDILKEGSLFLIVSQEMDKIEKGFGVKVNNGEVYIPGIISRKKQVAPVLEKVFG